MTLLCDLCVKYGTDKGPRSMNGWDYSPIYHRLLKDRRESVKKVLEIGVCGHRDIPNNVIGASLFVWRDYFPNADIYGIDNDGRWMVNGEARISTHCLDAYNEGAMDAFLMEFGWDFDFICDDAVHDPIPQVSLLHSLWASLAPGGIYAMEDVCPYKLPGHDLRHMTRLFPPSAETTTFSTHKEERLLIIR